MENILINFTSDATGLQPGIDGLVQLETIDKELAAQVKQTAAEMTKRDKVLSDGAKAGKKDVEGLATAFTNLSKSAVGGTYNKALETLQKNLKGTKDEFKQLSLVMEVAKKKMAELKPNSPEWKQLNDQVKAGEQVLRIFGEQEEKVAVKTKTLRGELRAMKEEIARKTVAGETGKDLDDLVAKAGNLDDALKDVSQQVSRTGSDTRSIEGFVQLLGTGTQVVAGMQAAQALLGNESEDFQKVMVKLNALLLISNSIQSVQSALLKESAVSTVILNLQKKAGILFTELQTAAESKNIVVRYAAVTAQRVLNAVMLASPAGILLTALGALAAAVLFFTSGTNKASDAQKRLNDDMENAIEINDRYNKGLNRAAEINLERLKLQGASEQQLREQSLRDAKRELDYQIALENRSRANYEKAADLRRKVATTGLRMNADLLEQANKTIEIFEGISEKKIELQDKFDLLEAQHKNATRTEIEKFDEQVLANQEQNYAKQKEAREKRLTDSTNFAAKERKAKFEIQKLALQDQLKTQEALINTDQPGTIGNLVALQKAFDLKKQLLAEERDFELKSVGITGSERILINQRYLSQIAGLERDLNKQRIDIIKAGGDLQASAEAASIEKRKKAIESSRGGRVNELSEQIALNNEILQTTQLTEDEKYRIRLDTSSKLAAIARQENILATQLYAENLISYQDYQAMISKAQSDASNARIEQARAEEDAKAEERRKKAEEDQEIVRENALIRQRTEEIANSLIDIGFSLIKRRHETELTQAEELFNKKLISETEYNKRVGKIKTAQARSEQQKALFEIAIQTAKNIVESFKNPLLVGLAIALGAAQSGIVLAQPLPRYRRGKVGIDGPGSETSDSIPALISRGESVINAKQTAKHQLALEAINNNKFKEYLDKYEAPKFYQNFTLPHISEADERRITISNTGSAIDYEKLGDVVAQKLAKEMANLPQTHLSFDQDGFNLSIQKGLEQINYKNKKLNL